MMAKFYAKIKNKTIETDHIHYNPFIFNLTDKKKSIMETVKN